MLEALTRRRDWLNERINAGEHSQRSVHWMKAERAALSWAIPICELHVEEARRADERKRQTEVV
jgi:hypothetical protein